MIEQKPLKLKGKTYPKNLEEFLKENPDWQKKGWKILPVYFLELSHGLMGFFPACFDKIKGRIVLTTDKQFIKKVWQTLEPKDSKLNESLCYVNSEGTVCYQVNALGGESFASADQILTEDEFSKLKEDDLRWGYGLMSFLEDPNKEAFLKMIEEAIPEPKKKKQTKNPV